MSLDLGSEGAAYNGTKVAGTAAGLAALTLGDFDTGDAAATSSTLILELDNSGTPAPDIATSLPTPTALGVVGGTKLVVVNDTNGKKVTFTDPITGIVFDYVNRAGESITLVASDGVWVMAF